MVVFFVKFLQHTESAGTIVMIFLRWIDYLLPVWAVLLSFMPGISKRAGTGSYRRHTNLSDPYGGDASYERFPQGSLPPLLQSLSTANNPTTTSNAPATDTSSSRSKTSTSNDTFDVQTS